MSSMVDEWKDAAQLERDDQTRRDNEFAWQSMELMRWTQNNPAGTIEVRDGKRRHKFHALTL
jgi:hypothetical protein